MFIKSITKLACACIALSSLSVFAQTASTQADDNLKVTLPDLKTKLEFDVAALWLKPGASNLNYVIYNKELPAQSPTWTEQEISPTFTPAFELGLRYFFPNAAGKDIHLDWTHLSSNNSSTTTADNVSYFLGPDYEIGPAGIPIRNALGNAKFRYDVVNLDVGQLVAFGQNLNIRFFGGLSTGFLREEVAATYTGTRIASYPGPFSMYQDVVSNFTGVGPRLGLHADFHTQSGFGLLGEAAVSTLIGSEYSKTSYAGSGQEVLTKFGTVVNNQYIADQRVYQVIPGIDAKLGVSYTTHPLTNGSIFTLSAGYQAAVYINAISQYLPASLVASPPSPLESGGIFVATMSHTLSNYSVQGPFLNLSVQI